MADKKKSFRECTIKFLEKTFGLDEVDELPALTAWMSMVVEITDFEKSHLLYYRDILDFNVNDWNERELDTHFIGPVFTTVNYSGKKFNHFVQRRIEGTVNGWELFGEPDGIIASGRREPEIPYFAFQEYKKQLDPHGDPAGQVLAAMMVAQELNDNKLPIYGCYVVGRHWYFMILEDEKFAVTDGHNATRAEQLLDIFMRLKALKQMIEKFVSLQSGQ